MLFRRKSSHLGYCYSMAMAPCLTLVACVDVVLRDTAMVPRLTLAVRVEVVKTGQFFLRGMVMAPHSTSLHLVTLFRREFSLRGMVMAPCLALTAHVDAVWIEKFSFRGMAVAPSVTLTPCRCCLDGSSHLGGWLWRCVSPSPHVSMLFGRKNP